MSMEMPVVLITTAEPQDVNSNSTVSTMIAVFPKITTHATAGDRLDVGLQEKILRIFWRCNVQLACVTIVFKSSVKTASRRLSHGQR